MTPEGFAELIRTLGLPLAILIGVLLSGARGMWVFGRSFEDMKEDRDYWRTQALKGTDLADSALAATPPRRVRVRP